MADKSHPKPYLRKGTGSVGKLMKKISYPVLQNRKKIDATTSTETELYSKESNESAVPHNERNYDRPITAGTADSGFREEDGGSVILSPESLGLQVESIVVDVSDGNSEYSTSSMHNSVKHRAPSVIVDVSIENLPKEFENESLNEIPTLKANQASIAAANKNKNDLWKVDEEQSFFSKDVLADSTVFFEKAEAHFKKLDEIEEKKKKSDNSSSDTDAASSKYWRAIIQEMSDDLKKWSTTSSSPKSISTRLSSFSPRIDSQNLASDENSSDLSKKDTLNEPPKDVTDRQPTTLAVPSISHKPKNVESKGEKADTPSLSSHSSSASVSGLPRSYSTPLLEKSLECSEDEKFKKPHSRPLDSKRPKPILKKPPSSRSTEKNITLNELQSLGLQLRDLIAHLDVSSERNRLKMLELENINEEIIEESKYYQSEVEKLRSEMKRLEESNKLWSEKYVLLEESVKLKGADFERLKKENAILNRQKRSKENDGDEMLKLLREQVEDLRNNVRDLEKQRTDLRLQKSKLDSSLKDKNKLIDNLQSEKTRLENRVKLLTNQKATLRGQQASQAFSAETLQRATNKAPVSAFTKYLTPAITNGTAQHALIDIDDNNTNEDVNKVNQARNSTRALVSGPPSARNTVKTVRWDEPLENAFYLSPPQNSRLTNNFNTDMRLVRTEDNIVGHASLYMANENDYTVYTLTYCGCSYYEYNNRDTRWIDSTNRYQMNYFGQTGATTLEIEEGRLLIRYFLNGQFEIYRSNGETTLVSPSGRRTELIKNDDGFYVQIFETDKTVRLIKDGREIKLSAAQKFCYSDSSYVIFSESDRSHEWRADYYIIRRFNNGDVKVRLIPIETSVTMLVMDVGTVKHLSKPVSCPKYCVEWGRIARQRSRLVASQRSVLQQL